MAWRAGGAAGAPRGVRTGRHPPWGPRVGAGLGGVRSSPGLVCPLHSVTSMKYSLCVVGSPLLSGPFAAPLSRVVVFYWRGGGGGVCPARRVRGSPGPSSACSLIIMGSWRRPFVFIYLSFRRCNVAVQYGVDGTLGNFLFHLFDTNVSFFFFIFSNGYEGSSCVCACVCLCG